MELPSWPNFWMTRSSKLLPWLIKARDFGSLGGEEILDELRVVIRDNTGTTAFFCFSTQIKGLNQLRIYGPAGSITADIVTGSLIRN